MANTDPAHWFLASALLPASRTPPFTSNNQVDVLIDGQAYMAHLDARLKKLNSGDYFHLSGWRVNSDEKLLGSQSTNPDFLTQVKNLIAQKVTVRAMVWYFPGSVFGIAANHPQQNIHFVREIIQAGGQAILDERFRKGVFSAHHQKTAVLRSQGVDWAYVGGIDICPDRWDTPAHDSSPERNEELFKGWHDVQCAVRGPAVAHVWQNFTDRWNDPTKPHSYSFAPGGEVPSPITSPTPSGGSFGTHYVQMLRTLACKNPPYPFAPDGEQTVRLAYERAIDLAEHYIYIEDQYLWSCSLREKLTNAAARGVKIILILSHNYDAPGLIYYHNSMRNNFITSIQRGLPSGVTSGVFPYHLQQTSGPDIYVHSKPGFRTLKKSNRETGDASA